MEALMAHWNLERLTRLAAELNITVEPLDPERLGIGVRVLSTDQCHIDVVQMLFNWRICETELDELFYGRWWCIPGRGDDAFKRAIIEAARYAGNPDDEPRGFIRSWDGRRG